METVKIFASTSGLRPFSSGRVSFILAATIAALFIAKLVNAYLFCGFNANFYVDLPVGIALFVGCCVTPLLGLAVDREATTKCGRCCRGFLIAVLYAGFYCSFAAAFMTAQFSVMRLGTERSCDPFNVCGDRSIEATKAQFSNAMPTFELVHRVDVIFKLLIAIGWIFVAVFSLAAAALSLVWSIEVSLKQDVREVVERRSEVGSVDVRMENLRNEINEPGSNAEPQFEEANEPEFSIVDEEEGTAATATMEASN